MALPFAKVLTTQDDRLAMPTPRPGRRQRSAVTLRAPLARIARRPALAAIVAATCAVAATAQPAASSTAQQWLEAMDAAFANSTTTACSATNTVNRSQQFSFTQSGRDDNAEIGAAAAQPEAGRPGASFARRERRTLGFGVGYRTVTRLATFRVVHKVVDGVERERIVHLNGPPREILRVGDEVTYMLQSGDELLAFGARPRRAPTTACSGAATTK